MAYVTKVRRQRYQDVPPYGACLVEYDANHGERKGNFHSSYHYWRRNVKVAHQPSPMPNPSVFKPGPATRFGTLDGTFDDLKGKIPQGAGVRNKAYARFVGEVKGDSASLLVVAGEWSETTRMIASRLLWLRRSYSMLRRGLFKDFLESLSLRPLRRHRRLVRNLPSDASALFLEYWFGWAPLTSEVGNLLQIFSQPIPHSAISKGASTRLSFMSENSSNYRQTHNAQYRARTGGNVQITNPNLYLAEKAGLLNVPLAAWELVPFSFLVDWAFDVQTYLSSLTDLAGVSVTEPFTTMSLRDLRSERLTRPYGVGWEFAQVDVATGFLSRREIGLISPVPNFNVTFNVKSIWQRAASAASLLVQVLGRGSRNSKP